MWGCNEDLGFLVELNWLRSLIISQVSFNKYYNFSSLII